MVRDGPGRPSIGRQPCASLLPRRFAVGQVAQLGTRPVLQAAQYVIDSGLFGLREGTAIQGAEKPPRNDEFAPVLPE